jgi:hypothetical protein
MSISLSPPQREREGKKKSMQNLVSALSQLPQLQQFQQLQQLQQLQQQLKQFKHLRALQSDMQSWCIQHPMYCTQLVAVLGSLGVPSPLTLVLLLKNQEAILSLFQYLAKQKKYKQQFQGFFTQQLGLHPHDLASVQNFQGALFAKLQTVCSRPTSTYQKQLCMQAQSQLQQLASFLQPLLRN